MRRSIAFSVKNTVLFTALALCAMATAAGPAAADVIQDKYGALGGSGGPLGAPISGYRRTADGQAKFQKFANGAIYELGGRAFAIWGLIYAKWDQLGRERSPVGYPVTDELPTADGQGRYSAFQHGFIVWSPRTGANAVWGEIGAKYWAAGNVLGYGYPVTDELPTPDGRGRFNHFSGDRSIYWTPQTGAHLIYGGIRHVWASMGWERSWLGYPISDEQSVPGGGRIVYFERGVIFQPVNGAAYASRG